MISLGNRLALIASLVPEGSAACDVGTDHGYLSAALCLSGRVSSMVATDIRPKPLESAKENLKRLGVEGVKLILCDGLDGVCRNEADCVIIAGMGGEVISGIISRSDFLKDSEITLILQPMTASVYLRDFLAENGFFIKKELAVEENGRIYSVMQVSFDGIIKSNDAVYRRIGALTADTVEGARYIEKQYRVCMKCADELKAVPEKKAEYKEYRTAAEGIRAVLEDRNGI